MVFAFRMLQEKLDQPVSEPPSPNSINNGDTASNLTEHINHLREEVQRLRNQLSAAQAERELLNLFVCQNFVTTDLLT